MRKSILSVFSVLLSVAISFNGGISTEASSGNVNTESYAASPVSLNGTTYSSTVYSDYNFENTNGTIYLTSYKGSEASIRIPAKAEINGTTYPVAIKAFLAGNAKNIAFEKGVILDNISFYKCTNIKSVDFTGANSSKMTTANYMFGYCYELENITWGSFDTKNITDMTGMFYYCSSLEKLDLTSFNTNSLTAMAGIVSNCSSLRELDLSSFDLSNITGEEKNTAMLNGCYSLEKLKTPRNLNVLRKFYYSGASICLYDESGNEYTSFPMGEDSLVSKTLTKGEDEILPDYSYLVQETQSRVLLYAYTGNETDIRIPATVTVNGETYHNVIWSGFKANKAKNITFEPGVIICNYTSFRDCTNLETVDFTGVRGALNGKCSSLFSNCRSLKSVKFGSSFKNNKPSQICNFFQNCKSLKCVDLSGFNTENIYDISSLFEGANNLVAINMKDCDLGKLSYSYMASNPPFMYCYNLQYIYVPKNVPEKWAFRLPRTLYDENGKAYNTLPTGLSESIVLKTKECKEKDIEELFLQEAGSAVVEQNTVSESDTTWQNDFKYSMDDTYITLKGYTGTAKNLKIPVKAVINGHDYFVNVGSLKLSGVENLSFERGVRITRETKLCNSDDLVSVDFTGVNTLGFTGSQHLLSRCPNLKRITWGPTFDFSRVTYMECTFYECTSLEVLDLSGLNTKSLGYMYQIVSSNNNVRVLNLSGCDFSNVKQDSFFYNTYFGKMYDLEIVYTPINVPEGVDISIGGGTFYDEEGNDYDTFPTGLSKSIKLYSEDRFYNEDFSDYKEDEEEAIEEENNNQAGSEATGNDQSDANNQLEDDIDDTEDDDDTNNLSGNQGSTQNTAQESGSAEPQNDAQNTGNNTDVNNQMGNGSSETASDTENVDNGSANDTTWQNDFTYVKKDGYITLNGYTGNSRNIRIPARAVIDGEQYSVYMGSISFENVDNLSFEKGVIITSGTSLARSSLVTVDFTGVDTSRLTHSQHLLSRCSNLKSVTWGPTFDTSNVEFIECMFYESDNLEKIDFSTFNTKKIQWMYQIVSGNNSVKELNLTGCDFSNIKTDDFFTGNYISNMYDLEVVYTPINVPENADIPLRGKFYDTNGVCYTEFPTGTTKSIKLISEELYLQKILGNTAKEEAVNDVDNDTEEEATYVPVDTKICIGTAQYNVTGDGTVSCFKPKNKKLKRVTIPSNVTIDGISYAVTSIDAKAFSGCRRITNITIPSSVTVIGKNAFSGCSNLKKIVINANSNLVIQKNAFKNINPDSTIYVKGVSGKTKQNLVKKIQKQTTAKVK